MNLLTKIIQFAFFGLSAQTLYAESITISSFKELPAIVDKEKPESPSDLLLLLDVDMTLIEPNHPALTYPFFKKYHEAFKKILSLLSPEEKDKVSTFVSQKLPQNLIEKETPGIIKELQKKNIKVIGFTASLTGQLKGFKQKALFEKRDSLQKMGIDFISAFNDRSHVVPFTSYPLYCGFYPMFYHGLLSSNGEGKFTKGEVLISFLEHVGKRYDEVMSALKKPLKGYYPKVIMMVDDRKNNLETVENALKKYDASIKFIGITYSGAAEKKPTKEITEKEFNEFWKNQISKYSK
jgi:hypothetical protein